jgi:hypothetical protein
MGPKGKNLYLEATGTMGFDFGIRAKGHCGRSNV